MATTQPNFTALLVLAKRMISMLSPPYLSPDLCIRHVTNLNSIPYGQPIKCHYRSN